MLFVTPVSSLRAPLNSGLSQYEWPPNKWFDHHTDKFEFFLLSPFPADQEEYNHLQEALKGSKAILNYVNNAVKECENKYKLEDFNKRLDKKSVDAIQADFPGEVGCCY